MSHACHVYRGLEPLKKYVSLSLIAFANSKDSDAPVLKLSQSLFYYNLQSEQHLNSVGVRRQIGLKIVGTLSVYFTKNVSCGYSSRVGSQTVLGRFINLLGVKLSFTLERVASNEYPLQTFSLVSIGFDLVPSGLYCKDILARLSDNRGILR